MLEGKHENVPEVQMVIFKLEKEEFAVDINQVREVLNLTQITPLPRSPHYIEGVINLRGEVIPVIDLRKRFGLPDLENGERARVIIVEIQSNNVGLTVDSVTEVLRYSAGAIQAPPSRGIGSRTDFIKGIAKLEERLLTILNLEKILTTDEVISMEEVTVSGN
jgi:purine-binding chemotaxis protein CheW